MLDLPKQRRSVGMGNIYEERGTHHKKVCITKWNPMYGRGKRRPESRWRDQIANEIK